MVNMASWHVYIVKCADETLYTGVTTDLKRRLLEHNTGCAKSSKYTRRRLPVELVYSEKFKEKSPAFKREAEIKKFTRREKLKLISSK